MRKPHPGKGAIKLRVDICTVSGKKLKLTSYWNQLMSVKQAIALVLRCTNVKVGAMTFYTIESVMYYPIQQHMKHLVLPAELVKDQHTFVYSTDFYILVSPNGTEPNFGNAQEHVKLRYGKPVSSRPSPRLDPLAGKDLGSPSTAEDSAQGGTD